MSTDKTNTTDENATPLGLGNTSPTIMGRHGRPLTKKKQPTDPLKKRSGRAVLQTAEREMAKANTLIAGYVKEAADERKLSAAERQAAGKHRVAAEARWDQDDAFQSSTENNFQTLKSMIEQSNDPQGLIRAAEQAKAKATKEASLRRQAVVNARELKDRALKAEAAARDLEVKLAAATGKDE
jgi:hypothetical protein